MYQPAQLDSFIRLLICHLETVLTQGEQLIDSRSEIMRFDLLQYAIELGDQREEIKGVIDQQYENEILFALQLSQAREWVDRLGQLDRHVERETDEFLAATYSIEILFQNGKSRKQTYLHENIMTPLQGDCALRGQLRDQIDIDAMMCAIFEFLGRLEDQYDILEELFEQKQIVNGVPFGQRYQGSHSAKIIPLFGAAPKCVSQDNEQN